MGACSPEYTDAPIHRCADRCVYPVFPLRRSPCLHRCAVAPVAAKTCTPLRRSATLCRDAGTIARPSLHVTFFSCFAVAPKRCYAELAWLRQTAATRCAGHCVSTFEATRHCEQPTGFSARAQRIALSNPDLCSLVRWGPLINFEAVPICRAFSENVMRVSSPN